MSSISLKELAKVSGSSSDFTYKDLHFDLIQNEKFISTTRRSVKAKDISDSIDEAAIANSIFNILNTRIGQRFLVPTFGCNLLAFVGRPVTEYTGREIGRTLYDAIRIWEPRVTIDDVLVVAKADEHEYDITVTVTIPSLKKTDVKLVGVLTSSGIIEARLN